MKPLKTLYINWGYGGFLKAIPYTRAAVPDSAPEELTHVADKGPVMYTACDASPH